jgi:hypothetical protein
MTMRKHLCWAAALAVVFTAPLAAQDNTAALVVRLQGDVRINRGGGTAAAAVGSRLDAGDEVVPASGARAILITRTGAQQVVTQTTTIADPPAGGNPDLFARAISTLAHAASGDARMAGGRQGMIRPVPGEPVLVSPRNDLTVTTDRPSFTWLAVPGASEYTLQIRNAEGGRPLRFESRDTTWTVPADMEPLNPGDTYAWTVAPRGGRPTREQRFRVIGPDQKNELAATLQSVVDLGLDPSGDGAFLTAVVYRDMDLYYAAADALRAVERAGSMSAEVYMLKGEILNQLGRADDARAAFDKADEMMR